MSAPGFAGKHDVYVYTPEDAPHPSLVGKGHPDSLAMNAAFQASVTAAMEKEGDPPYVVHGHDGHCGLLPLYVQRSGEFFRRSSSLTTIHNAGLAYQQIFPDFDEALSITGLPAAMLNRVRIENQVNPFLAAAVFGHINTVYPAYARRLRGGKEPFSGHLSRVFHERKIALPGIYNGLEPSVWLQFLPDPPGTRKSCRRLVHEQIMMKLPSGVDIAAGRLDPGRPWVLFHGRLTPQKGLDEILRLSGTFSADIIVYGRGDPETDNAVADWASSDSGRVFSSGI